VLKATLLSHSSLQVNVNTLFVVIPTRYERRQVTGVLWFYS
jgi:hypothetical protein